METDPRAAYRYAVYFSPGTEDAWWQAGSRWVGRDAVTGECHQPTAMARSAAGSPLAVHLAGALADPLRYGWHATLRAPFRPGQGVSPETIRDTVAALASRLDAFDMPPLAVRRLGHFLAVTPKMPSARIAAVAEACVRAMQPLAAPLTAEELARRRRAPLTPRQDALLERWGYPFVMEEFRFHCSLTGTLKGLSEEEVDTLQTWAREVFDTLPPTRFDGLSLFVEPARGEPFERVERFAMRQLG